jgi:hypothetical protein
MTLNDALSVVATETIKLMTERDALAAELAETQRQLKIVAPVGRYNGRNIEEWAAYGAALEAALRTVREIISSDSVEYDDVRNAEQIIGRVLESSQSETPAEAKVCGTCGRPIGNTYPCCNDARHSREAQS